MAEEIRGAALIVPQTMVLSLVINGVLGLSAIIAVFFCVGNSDNALDASLASPTGYPFIEIFATGVGSIAGATLMSSIILIMQTFAAIGLVATTSRIYWSFARDKGVPCWKWLSAVSLSNLITAQTHNSRRSRSTAAKSPSTLLQLPFWQPVCSACSILPVQPSSTT